MTDPRQQFGTKYEDRAWAVDWWRVAGLVGAFIVSTAGWYLALRVGQFLWR